MTLVTLDLSPLLIPECWDVFVYGGYVYRRAGDRFVRGGAVA